MPDSGVSGRLAGFAMGAPRLRGQCGGMATQASSPVLPSCPSCPHCQASRVVRWGWVRTVRAPPRRRFRCRGCGRTFSENTGRALAGSWYPGRWAELCRDLVAQTSVRATARRLGVAPSTAFRWRHRALQALADHGIRSRGQRLGEAGGSGGDGGGGVVGVATLPLAVSRRRGPEDEPRRYFRLLVATDLAGRVVVERDVPGPLAGPPGTPLPRRDWPWSERRLAQFPPKPADEMPSPRRLLERWCAPGSQVHWVGLRLYRWAEVAGEFGMTAVRGGMAGTGAGEVADGARLLMVELRQWLRRYGGVSTRWLRGYLALFAETRQGPRQGQGPRPGAGLRWERLRGARRVRAQRQLRAALAWRLVDISARGREGAAARGRRAWVG